MLFCYCYCYGDCYYLLLLHLLLHLQDGLLGCEAFRTMAVKHSSLEESNSRATTAAVATAFFLHHGCEAADVRQEDSDSLKHSSKLLDHLFLWA